MTYYKGYRVGMLEKSVLKLLLGICDVEFPIDRNKFSDDRWSLIFRTYRQKTEMPAVIKRLKEKGLIRLLSKNNKLLVCLTNKGKYYLRDNFLFTDVLKNTTNRQWNKKWHIVVFDIPESRRKIRNIFRFHLKKIGFVQIQASVWVYPFKCDEVITLVKTYFNLMSEVVYITADFVEGSTALKRKFKL